MLYVGILRYTMYVYKRLNCIMQTYIVLYSIFYTHYSQFGNNSRLYTYFLTFDKPRFPNDVHQTYDT